jgi:hypothetical protein
VATAAELPELGDRLVSLGTSSPSGALLASDPDDVNNDRIERAA